MALQGIATLFIPARINGCNTEKYYQALSILSYYLNQRINFMV